MSPLKGALWPSGTVLSTSAAARSTSTSKFTHASTIPVLSPNSYPSPRLRRVRERVVYRDRCAICEASPLTGGSVEVWTVLP
ncbi:hypothetical protein BV22DRAFT_1030789 [Leucogyrophana mollusca]|uniref:Uncharacterized protein n=1 Tax=Leucogyrophana mollusca TaxID=85980 RepID=A0ACB8BQV5_9AGAM|nr:hypothetical protein BV22DRAFT_1030789 [Leucogyrophana mollusca]